MVIGAGLLWDIPGALMALGLALMIAATID